LTQLKPVALNMDDDDEAGFRHALLLVCCRWGTTRLCLPVRLLFGVHGIR